MSLMKTTLILVLAGAFIGAILASFIVPPALAWYSSPGGLPQGAQVQAVVQIPEVIRYATSGLLRGQAIGAGIGGALGLILGIALGVRARSRARLRAADRAAPAPGPAPEPQRPS